MKVGLQPGTKTDATLALVTKARLNSDTACTQDQGACNICSERCSGLTPATKAACTLQVLGATASPTCAFFAGMSPEGTQSQPAAAAALEAASPQDGAPPISEECVTVVVHETAEDAQTEVTNADRPDKHASQGGGRDQQAVKETEKGPQPPAGAAPGPAGAAGSGQQAPPAGASDIEVEQQAAATEQSPAGGPSNQAAASGAAAAGTGAGTAPNGMPGLTLRSALNDLVDDIFGG